VRRRRPGNGHARRAFELALGALALLLALGSSVVWGCADFGGGWVTRRLPVFAVALVSQLAGFVPLVAAILVRGDLDGRSLWIGALGGIGGAVGLSAFYKAMAVGTMSVVSPITACSALVPFVLSLATGERPATIAAMGAILALSGAILASLEERKSSSPERARAVLLAVVSAVAIGLFVYFVGLGSREGDALSTLVGARIGSLAALVCLVLGSRTPVRIPRAWLPAVAVVGLGDVTANALFASASGHGLLSLVSVLGSLYPVVTLLLAYVVLRERLTRAQQAGVAIALVGVVAIAAA
jgi:drug/metabolite transporter (DMT)-like permease